ncbi:MAG: monovalent cation:proton antiporter family protein [Cyanobacteriota bacterium]
MDHQAETTFFPLLIVSLLAFFIPILTSWFSQTTRLSIPSVVGEIICGIIIGNSLLGLIPSTDSITWLKFLSLFGFTYLMFLSGLEIDFGVLTSEGTATKISKKKGFLSKPLNIGFAYFGATLCTAMLLCLAMYYLGYLNNWLFMGLILATVSVGIVVPILKEKELLKTFLGQTILICALVADFISMILITVFVAIYTHGIGSTTFIVILLVGLFGLIIYKLYLSNVFEKVLTILNLLKPVLNKLSHATTQIKVRGSIALMIIFIFLSQLLSLEIILGAFIAGILATLILGKAKTSELEMKLDAIGYGFFIPIFFISVGIDLDLRVFSASSTIWNLIIVLTLAAFIVKILPSFLFKANFNLRNSLSSGILLTSNLSLPIAAATIGVKAGFITESSNTAIIIMAVVTCIISPIIFNKVFKTESQSSGSNIVIIGANILGILIAKRLLEQNQNIIIIALNKNEFNEAKNNGLAVVSTINNIEDALLFIDTSIVNTLISTTEDDKLNLRFCLNAKNEYGINNLMSIINDPNNFELFEEQKIETINKVSSAAENFVNKIITPEGYAILSRQDDEIMIADMWVTNSDYDNKTLMDISFPGNTLVVQIRRGNEHIIPHGNTVIKVNDSLTLVGNPKSVKDCINLIGTPPNQYCPKPYSAT